MKTLGQVINELRNVGVVAIRAERSHSDNEIVTATLLWDAAVDLGVLKKRVHSIGYGYRRWEAQLSESELRQVIVTFDIR